MRWQDAAKVIRQDAGATCSIRGAAAALGIDRNWLAKLVREAGCIPVMGRMPREKYWFEDVAKAFKAGRMMP